MGEFQLFIWKMGTHRRCSCEIYRYMLGIQLYGIKLFVRLTRIPLYILIPSILVLCSVGSFSIHNRFFDIWVLFIFGILGYLMFKVKIPLGPMAETNFRRAIMTDPDLTLFLTRPISLAFILMAVASLVYPFYKNYRTNIKDPAGPSRLREKIVEKRK